MGILRVFPGISLIFTRVKKLSKYLVISLTGVFVRVGFVESLKQVLLYRHQLQNIRNIIKEFIPNDISIRHNNFSG